MSDAIPQHPPTYWGLVEHRASDSPEPSVARRRARARAHVRRLPRRSRAGRRRSARPRRARRHGRELAAADGHRQPRAARRAHAPRRDPEPDRPDHARARGAVHHQRGADRVLPRASGVARLRVRRARRGDRGRDRVHGARQRHVAHRRSVGAATAARTGASAALALPHVGIHLRPQGRVARRHVGHREHVRVRHPDPAGARRRLSDLLPRHAHRWRRHARRGTARGLPPAAGRGVRRRADTALHGRAGRDAARHRAPHVPGVPRRATRARRRTALPAAARLRRRRRAQDRRDRRRDPSRARRHRRRRAAGASPSSPPRPAPASTTRRSRSRRPRADRRPASSCASWPPTAATARPARRASSVCAARTSSSATPTPRSTPTRSTSRATSGPATSASSPPPGT